MFKKLWKEIIETLSLKGPEEIRPEPTQEPILKAPAKPVNSSKKKPVVSAKTPRPKKSQYQKSAPVKKKK